MDSSSRIAHPNKVKLLMIAAGLIKNVIPSFVHKPHSTICNKENISSRFSSISEAFAPELLRNLEEMCPQYYIHSDMFSMFESSTTY